MPERYQYGEQDDPRRVVTYTYAPPAAGERKVYSYDPAGALVSIRNVPPGEPMPAPADGAGLPRSWIGLRMTLKFLVELHAGPITVVETGTSGFSNTGVWGLLAQRSGGQVYTVAADPAALEPVRSATRGFSCVHCVPAEPAEFLRGWAEKHPGEVIQLLYLDSVETDGPDATDRRHVEEALAAAPAMAERGLVLFRDPAGGEGGRSEGQPSRAAGYLSERGFDVLWTEDRWVLIAARPGLNPGPWRVEPSR